MTKQHMWFFSGFRVGISSGPIFWKQFRQKVAYAVENISHTDCLPEDDSHQTKQKN